MKNDLLRSFLTRDNDSSDPLDADLTFKRFLFKVVDVVCCHEEDSFLFKAPHVDFNDSV